MIKGLIIRQLRLKLFSDFVANHILPLERFIDFNQSEGAITPLSVVLKCVRLHCTLLSNETIT